MGERVNATGVIKEVFKGELPYVSVDKLSKGERRSYCLEAQKILNSPVFKNEINHIIIATKDAIGYSAKDFGEVLDLRMSINGIEALRERLKELADGASVKKEELTDPHAAI